MILCRDTLVVGVSGQEGAASHERRSGSKKRGRGGSSKKVRNNYRQRLGNRGIPD